MDNAIKTTLIAVGVILAVIGLIGIFANWYVGWMWASLVVGVIGILWGWLAPGTKSVQHA